MMDMCLPSNRKFGTFFALIFGVSAICFYAQGYTSAAIGFAVVAGAFLMSALFFASILTPLNRLWMRFGFLLGRIVSPVILAVIYFGLFVPVGLMMRVFGRDELRLKRVTRDTHWKIRTQESPDHESFKNQF